ncbi:MAG: SDR family NAD(P)-dependent oxidoreductase [Myxococcota bacterium]
MLTGATGGVGEALVQELTGRGATLLLTGRRPDALTRLAATFGAQRLVADLADPFDRRRLGEALAQFQADTLIHNAAIQFALDFSQDDPDLLAQRALYELDVDLGAPIALTAAALPCLGAAAARLGRPGALVFVTSGLAIAPKQSAPVYCTAKAGLRHFTRALRYQLQDAGLSLTAHEVVLPMVDTPMNRSAAPGKMTPAAAARALARGVARGHAEVLVGPTRWLPLMSRLAPGLTRRLLRSMGTTTPSSLPAAT